MVLHGTTKLIRWYQFSSLVNLRVLSVLRTGTTSRAARLKSQPEGACLSVRRRYPYACALIICQDKNSLTMRSASSRIYHYWLKLPLKDAILPFIDGLYIPEFLPRRGPLQNIFPLSSISISSIRFSLGLMHHIIPSAHHM